MSNEYFANIGILGQTYAALRTQVRLQSINWEKRTAYSAPVNISLFQLVANQGKDLANRALDALMSGAAARMHSGQTTAGMIASGLSASAIRVPEIRTGMLVAVSI